MSHRPSLTRGLLALGLSAALLTGCGSSDDQVDTGRSTTSSSTAASTTAVGGQATVSVPEVPVTPEGADGCRTPEEAAALTEPPEVAVPEDPATAPFATDDIAGCGALFEQGSPVSVQYRLVGTDGEQLDSSWDRGTPFSVVLGAGQVIDGWDQGLVGMRVGGRRTLVIPPELAYGPEGSGHQLAGQTLIFVVDAVGLVELPAPTPADAPDCRTPEEAEAETQAPEVGATPDPEGAELAVDTIPGCGDPVGATSTIRAHYYLADTDGTKIETSWDGGSPFSAGLGQNQVIKGWDYGLVGMRAGGRRTLVVPPDLAYGPAGSGHELAGKTLVFVVDVLAVS